MRFGTCFLVGGFCAAALRSVLTADSPEFLHGMDDDITIRRVQQILADSDLPLWDIVVPAPAAISLGVYEPVTLACRVFVSWCGGAVTPRLFAALGVWLHGTATSLACLNAHTVLRLLEGSEAEVTPPVKDIGHVRRTARSRQQLLCSAAATVLLGAHPMRAEVVCWTSCHGYMLACIFSLQCIRSRLSGNLRTELLYFCLAVFSKAAAVSLPLVLLLAELAFVHRSVAPKAVCAAFITVIPMLLVAIAAALAATLAAGEVPADARSLDLSERLLRACYAPIFYLCQTFVLPWRWTTPRLALPEQGQLSLAQPFFAASAAAVATASLILPVVLLAVLRSARQHGLSLLWLAWLAYLGSLLPTLGLDPHGHVWALAADRYAYIPSLCVLTPTVAVLVSWLASIAPKLLPRRAQLCASVLGILLLAALSWRANQIGSLWASGSDELFEAMLRQAPGEFSTLKDLGTLHLKQGNISAAQRSLGAAMALRPGHGGVLLNMATLLHQSRRTAEAELVYRRARQAVQTSVAQCPTCQAPMTELAKVDGNLGGLLLQSRRAAEAVAVLEAGAPWDNAVSKSRAPGLRHLGIAYAALGRKASAARLQWAAAVAAGDSAEAARSESRVIVSGIR
eukprot:TRINITY_DN32783_c0_g1_i1.p1 TRINITY_DN32783_c0_g1~~TRINITY_DN32783_c0_g1_i1.p1  ORF type:complete len:625 (-),score=96.84 TRINITY_DN32783_c0_g1_i1:28-1902(-)